MNKIDYTKLNPSYGWYIVKDSIVLNRGQAHCPAPVGAKLYTVLSIKSSTINESDGVYAIHCDDVVAWINPEDLPGNPK